MPTALRFFPRWLSQHSFRLPARYQIDRECSLGRPDFWNHPASSDTHADVAHETAPEILRRLCRAVTLPEISGAPTCGLARLATASVACALALCAGRPVAAQDITESLAAAAQNPIAAMISVPFQNNTYFVPGPITTKPLMC